MPAVDVDQKQCALTEWPLGRTTAEAEELAAPAKAKGVQTSCGLQSRVSPALLYMKELIEAGYSLR
jgi:predicted dehydrogenase